MCRVNAARAAYCCCPIDNIPRMMCGVRNSLCMFGWWDSGWCFVQQSKKFIMPGLKFILKCCSHSQCPIQWNHKSLVLVCLSCTISFMTVSAIARIGGVGGCVCPNSSSMILTNMALWAIMDRPASSASAQCLGMLHCLVVWGCHLIKRNATLLCCLL